MVCGAFIFIWVAFFFDPEDYRDRVITWVTDRTGTSFSLNGELGVDFQITGRSSAMSISLGDMDFEDKEKFPRVKLFHVPKMTIEIPLLNLIQGHLRPMIEMHQPILKLIRVDNHTTNWSEVSSGIRGSQRATSEWDLIQGFTGLVSMGIRIFDGTVHWSRRDTGAEMEISKIDFVMTPFRSESTASLQIKLIVSNRGNFNPFFVDAAVTLGRDKDRESIFGEIVKLQVSGPSLLIAMNALEVETDKEFSRLQFRKARIVGALGGEEFLFQFHHGMYMQADDRLTVKSASGKWIGTEVEGGAELEDLSVSSVGERLIPFVSDQKSTALIRELPNLLEILDDLILASGEIVFSADDWTRLIPAFGRHNFGWSEPEVRPVDGVIELSVGASGLEIERFALSWTDSKLSGSLRRSESGQSRLQFAAVEEDLDFAKISLSSMIFDSNPAIGALVLLLNNDRLVAIGNITIKDAHFQRLEFTHIEIPVKTNGNRLHVNNAEFELYGGRGHVDAMLELLPDGFNLDTRQKYSNVDWGHFLRETGVSNQLEAIGDMNVNFSMRDSQTGSFFKTGHGRVMVTIPTGKIRTFGRTVVFGREIRKYLEQAFAPIGMNTELALLQDDVQFSNFEATMNLADGQVSIDDVSLEALHFRIEGRAKYHILEDWYDSFWYLSHMMPIENSKGSLFDLLQSVVIPLQISGRNGTMSVTLNLPELLRLLAD